MCVCVYMYLIQISTHEQGPCVNRVGGKEHVLFKQIPFMLGKRGYVATMGESCIPPGMLVMGTLLKKNGHCSSLRCIPRRDGDLTCWDITDGPMHRQLSLFSCPEPSFLNATPLWVTSSRVKPSFLSSVWIRTVGGLLCISPCTDSAQFSWTVWLSDWSMSPVLDRRSTRPAKTTEVIS